MSTAAIVGLAFGVMTLASQEARAQMIKLGEVLAPGGSDSDALRAACAPVRVHTKELSTYLVPESALTDEKFAAAIYASREWTDLVLVPSGR
jgi:hypothetical protein